MADVISCIRCGRRNKIVKIRGTIHDAIYRCGVCGALFDDCPDEGGTYSDRSPAARIEREERRRESRRTKVDRKRK